MENTVEFDLKQTVLFNGTFGPREIRELLSLRVDPIGSCEEVKEMAMSKLNDVEDRIRVLQAIRKSLEGLVTACEERQPTTECPILDCIERNKER